MGKFKKENRECFLEGEKGICSLCRYHRKGECPGPDHYNIKDINGNILFEMPLFDIYKDNYFKEFEAKVKESGLITKEELLNQLKKEGVEIASRTLTYYMDLGLIPKGNKTFIRGIAGSVSYFEGNTLLMITGIDKLTKKYGFTLKEISKYKDLIYNFKELEMAKYFSKLPEEIKNEYEIETDEFEGMKIVHNLHRFKFQIILKIYACAEAGYKYGLEIRGINGKVFMPIMHIKREGKRIIEIHVKIIDVNVLGSSVGKAQKDIKAFKEIIYSKRGIKIIG